MTDLISRADAIEAVELLPNTPNGYSDTYDKACIIGLLESLPSADAESDDIIIKGAKGIQDGLYNIKDGKLFKYKAKGGTVRTYPIVPSADAVSREFYEDAVKANIGLVIENRQLKEQIESADAVQGEWVPCDEKMPKELERVNVTWLNHNPPFYYQHIKDIPQTDTAVYYRDKWYWWDATVIDVLAEYGEDCNAEQIDKDIEVVAWMPLPKPYKGGDDE